MRPIQLANPAFPGAGGAPNTHVPRFDLQRSLIVGYSRNADDFPVNRYLQVVPVDKSTDLFLVLDRQNAVRLYDSGNEFVWPDGSEPPTGVNNTDDFNFQSFRTKRYSPSFRFGLKAEQEANWPIALQHSTNRAMQCMTLRTSKAMTLLTDSSQYTDGNTDTATDVAGGLLSAATSTNLYIKKALLAMHAKINLNTLGTVKKSDLHVIMNLNLANALSETDEVHNYMKGSYQALPVLTGGLGDNGGLPPELYGYKIEVENSVEITTKKNKNQTATSQLIWPDADLVMCARPGGLVGNYGAPSFSTITLFEKENLNTETRTDTWKRLVEGRVTDDYDLVMTAPSSGYLLTGCR
jgi:hypothetical protein